MHLVQAKTSSVDDSMQLYSVFKKIILTNNNNHNIWRTFPQEYHLVSSLSENILVILPVFRRLCALVCFFHLSFYFTSYQALDIQIIILLYSTSVVNSATKRPQKPCES